jgi:oxygen-independent coproporphyrinogen-3 oxidase
MAAGVYIHIPFCSRRCSYCDFYSTIYDDVTGKRYLDSLIREIEMTSYPGPIDTVYIGGGTPSLLPGSAIERIISKLYWKYAFSPTPEITLEVNPGTVDVRKLRDYKDAGVNRLSIGVQSLDTGDLETLGRNHGRKDALDTMRWTGKIFDNFSVDIIYGIPGQSHAGLRETLQSILEFSPPHISAYELSVEKGTALQNRISSGIMLLPSEEKIAGMYDLISETLNAHGFKHYEISNYSIPDYQCRHNMNYWLRGEYLGFGASAHSFYSEKRLNNVSDIHRYISLIEETGSAVAEVIEISDQDRINEMIFLGLRTELGVDLEGLSLDPPLLDSLVNNGYILIKNNRLSLTERGMLLSNRIIVEILNSLDSISL